MRHVHRTCTSPRWNGTATSNSNKMQATVSEAGMELVVLRHKPEMILSTRTSMGFSVTTKNSIIVCRP